MRELDERLGPSELIEQHLPESRRKNTQLPLPELLTPPSEGSALKNLAGALPTDEVGSTLSVGREVKMKKFGLRDQTELLR